MKTSTKLKAGCGILAVFAVGFVLGVVSLILIIAGVIPLSEGWKSDESKDYIADHFRNQLKLTPEQDAEFRPLVHEVLERRWELRRGYLLESRRLMEEEYLPRAAKILNQEQQEKAGKMLARWKRDQSFKVDSFDEESAIVEGAEKPGEDPDPEPEDGVRVRDPQQ